MRMFLLFLPFVAVIFAFEIVMCLALMKVASISDRYDEHVQMKTELHRQEEAATAGN